MKALAIETIRRDFPNQWLLIEVTEIKDGAPFKGVVLKASNRREEIVEEIGKNRDKKTVFSSMGLLHHPIRPSHFSSHLNVKRGNLSLLPDEEMASFSLDAALL